MLYLGGGIRHVICITLHNYLEILGRGNQLHG